MPAGPGRTKFTRSWRAVPPTTRLTTVVGGISLAITLAACGDSGATPSSEPASVTAVETTDSPPGIDDHGWHNDDDTMFAQMMIIHHEGAIEMADLAVERADSQQVRSLAEGISAAQGPEIRQMTSWLEFWDEEVSPPAHDVMAHEGMEMEGMNQQEAMSELESLSGAGFDRRFFEIMIANHRGAVEMAETHVYAGQNREALELAKTIIIDQQDEITQMEELLEGL